MGYVNISAYPKTQNYLIFLILSLALALNLLKGFNPMFFSPFFVWGPQWNEVKLGISHGDPGVEQTKLGINGFFTSARRHPSTSSGRAQREMNVVFTTDVSEEALAKSELIEVS